MVTCTLSPMGATSRLSPTSLARPAGAFPVSELRVPGFILRAWLESCDHPRTVPTHQMSQAGVMPTRNRGVEQVFRPSVSLGAGCSPNGELDRRKEGGDLEVKATLFSVILNTVSKLSAYMPSASVN